MLFFPPSLLSIAFIVLHTQPAINAKVYPDNDGNIKLSKGDHGYESKEMKGIMYAFGVDITNNQVIEEMDMVDHYGVFCQLLGLESRPNNGTTGMYDEILNKFAETSDEDKTDKDDDNNDDNSKEEGDKKDKKDDEDDDQDDNGSLRLGASSWVSVLLCLSFAFVLQYVVVY